MGADNSQQKKPENKPNDNDIGNGNQNDEELVPTKNKKSKRNVKKLQGNQKNDSPRLNRDGKKMFEGMMGSLKEKQNLDDQRIENNQNRGNPTMNSDIIHHQTANQQIDIKNLNVKQINELRAQRLSKSIAVRNLSSLNVNLKTYPQEGKIPLKITIVSIRQASARSKISLYKLQKRFSTHSAFIQWNQNENLQREAPNQTDSLIKFKLTEQDNYQTNFLVQKDGELIQGDQDLWKIINPLPSTAITNASSGKNKNIVKVGPYYCESSYVNYTENGKDKDLDDLQKNQGSYDSPSLKNLPVEYDLRILQNWGEMLPEKYQQQSFSRNRSQGTSGKDNKQFLPQKGIKESTKLIQYCETNRYFSTNSNEWHAGVYVQQRDLEFDAWIIQNSDKLKSGTSQNRNQVNGGVGNSPHYLVQNMSKSFKNDIKNREEMYLKSMKDYYIHQERNTH